MTRLWFAARPLVCTSFLGLATFALAGCGGGATDAPPPPVSIDQELEAQKNYEEIQRKESDVSKNATSSKSR
jgi:hypothetical protein